MFFNLFFINLSSYKRLIYIIKTLIIKVGPIFYKLKIFIVSILFKMSITIKNLFKNFYETESRKKENPIAEAVNFPSSADSNKNSRDAFVTEWSMPIQPETEKALQDKGTRDFIVAWSH